MARLPRLVVPHFPHHLIQTGNDSQVVFRDEEDHERFRAWLREAAQQFKVAVHAYVLMPNHFQLLTTPEDESGLARMTQWIGRQYVPYYNRKYQRAGTLWQGRYRATVIDPEDCFMRSMRYIELEPVRAGIVSDPADFKWSSYTHHAGLQFDPLIKDHAGYWKLGNTPFEREAAYRNLAERPLSGTELTAIKSAVHAGWALGTETFKRTIEKKIARRVEPGKKGRPAGTTSKLQSA